MRMSKKQIDKALIVRAKRLKVCSKALRSHREAKGMGRQELAIQSGLSYQTIHKIESGQRLPTLGTATLLGKVLGVNPQELMGTL